MRCKGGQSLCVDRLIVISVTSRLTVRSQQMGSTALRCTTQVAVCQQCARSAHAIERVVTQQSVALILDRHTSTHAAPPAWVNSLSSRSSSSPPRSAARCHPHQQSWQYCWTAQTPQLGCHVTGQGWMPSMPSWLCATTTSHCSHAHTAAGHSSELLEQCHWLFPRLLVSCWPVTAVRV